jgi:hypothetical protein
MTASQGLTFLLFADIFVVDITGLHGLTSLSVCEQGTGNQETGGIGYALMKRLNLQGCKGFPAVGLSPHGKEFKVGCAL